MPNVSSFDYSKAPPAINWGFPEGVTLLDTVPEDMKALIHPHWKSFPPVNPMWHFLLGFIYIILGAVSISGKLSIPFIFILFDPILLYSVDSTRSSAVKRKQNKIRTNTLS